MSCPACGSESVGGGVTVPDHEYALERRTVYVACHSCGARLQEPMPDEAELSRFYPSDSHSLSPRRTLASLRHQLRWRSLAHHLDRPGAVLDFGCGDDGFLRFATARAGGRVLGLGWAALK